MVSIVESYSCFSFDEKMMQPPQGKKRATNTNGNSHDEKDEMEKLNKKFHLAFHNGTDIF